MLNGSLRLPLLALQPEVGHVADPDLIDDRSDVNEEPVGDRQQEAVITRCAPVHPRRRRFQPVSPTSFGQSVNYFESSPPSA